MTSTIDAIKVKIDVVDEVGLVVALQKSGKAFKGLCPFHNERTPSFYVFPESQSWHCFGCNDGGDIFTFVQKQQGLEFREALLHLAEKAGVLVEEQSGRDPEEARELSAAKERLRKLNEDALLWFHQILLRAKEATGARTYLQSRGISSESVLAFGLGYAPEQWDGLSHYLLGQGYTERELISGGLAREREGIARMAGEEKSGGVYDYFRNRLIFPIRDTRGRVIGFGGRILGEGQPKYVNSPQTLLFEKNAVLYAIDMAKDAIKHTKQVIIVEGYVDAVIAHQYGTRQTVACIGSAITEKHIQQLKKLTKQVTLALDPDAAGASATEHGIQEALKGFDRTVVPVPMLAEGRGAHTAQSGSRRKQYEPRGMIRLEEQVDAEINVLELPVGEDPDEFIRRDFSGWSYAVTHPLPLVDYYFVVKTADLDLRQPGGKAEAAKRLLPVIATISDRVKRDAYLRKLANKITIDERSLNEELQRIVKGQVSTSVIAEFSDPRGQRTGKGRIEGGVSQRPVSADQSGRPTEISAEASEPADVGKRMVLDRQGRSRLQWEDYLIGLLLLNPGLSTHVCGIINDGDFAGTDTRELYHILNSIEQRDSSPLFQSFEQIVPSELLTTIARARKRVESGPPHEGTGLVKDAVQCATRLKRAHLLQLNTELKFLMEEANKSGDTSTVRDFQQQLLAIHRQLRTLNSAMHLQG